MKYVIDIETKSRYYERRKERRQSKEFRLHEKVIDKISESRRNNIDCDLTDENDLHWPDVCPILNVPLDYSYKNKRGPKPYSPSIDRKDPTKGYLKDNTWVISTRANTMKHNASVQELKQFAKWINTL